MQIKKHIYFGVVGMLVLTLAACGSSNDPVTPPPPPVVDTPPPPPPTVADAVFTVQVTNLTNAQPLSPVGIVFHAQGFNAFIDGEPASLGIEQLAEGGSNAELLSEAEAAAEFLVSASTAGPVPPRSISDAVELRFPSDQLDTARLTLATMLVHTNDAFSALNAANISTMQAGETREFFGPTWDSSTEANDELGLNMPGPDFGGEGFNSVRDDLFDRVHFHQGVVTNVSIESGLATADLEERHRFDNSTTKIVVTRTE